MNKPIGKNKCKCGKTYTGESKSCPSCCGKETTESKARTVVATLIGEAYPQDDDTDLPDVPRGVDTDDDVPAGHDHDEADMDSAEERTEVVIAHEILGALDNEDEDMESRHETIRNLCHELLDMHGQEGEDGPPSGPEGDEGGQGGDLEDFESDLGLDK